jgi:competence protein ComEC
MNKPVLFIFGILIGANLFTWALFFEARQPPNLRVDFLDVGQGDAILINTPDKQKIIIDGGPSYNLAAEKLAKKIPFWDREIDLMILTHPEKDHFIGLFKILKLYKVKNIVWTGDTKDTAEFQDFYDAALKEQAEEGAQIYELDAYDKILLGKTEIDILFPFKVVASADQESKNENCLVSRLVFNKNEFLFTGDIGKPEELEIIKSGEEIQSDVLKVAHHGSKYSSSEEFLNMVSPKVAVIQVGKNNSYGHPALETLERLNAAQIKAYRNDINGNIEIISDGNNLKILSETSLK